MAPGMTAQSSWKMIDINVIKWSQTSWLATQRLLPWRLCLQEYIAQSHLIRVGAFVVDENWTAFNQG